MLARLRGRRVIRLELPRIREDSAAPVEWPAAVSSRLRDFVAELPLERESIARFVIARAAEISAGSRVLDAGAGDAPYRELFAHCEYVTADWPQSVHSGGRAADIMASLDDLPIEAGSFDAVLSTQVLEHVRDPRVVLNELHRVTRPGGQLWLTVPLAWPLHEEPYDYWRYTPHSLRALLEDTSFDPVTIEPRNGCFSTLGQLAKATTWSTGRPDDGLSRDRDVISRALSIVASELAQYDYLDAQQIFPLGYSVVARRP